MAIGFIDVGDVYFWIWFRWVAVVLVGLVFFGIIVGVVLPVGFMDVLDILLGKSVVVVCLEVVIVGLEDRVLVGDIMFRYIYLDYMGMDLVEVFNSDGTIHVLFGICVQIIVWIVEVFDVVAIQVDY